MQPQCININCDRKVTYSRTNVDGTKRWRPVCDKCHRASYGAIPLMEGVKQVKKDHCENIDGRFGYICTAHIPYSGALELDHIDGDRENNTIKNVQTLCKICHSYKGHKKGDFKKNKISLTPVKGFPGYAWIDKTTRATTGEK